MAAASEYGDDRGKAKEGHRNLGQRDEQFC